MPVPDQSRPGPAGDPAPGVGHDDLARLLARQRADELRNVWRIAGALFIGAGLTSTPSSLLLPDPGSWAAVYGLISVSILAGLCCLVAGERRVSRAWLQPAIVLGTACVTAATAIAEPRYGFYYVFVAVFIGIAARRRVEFAAQLALLSAALLAPLLYTTGDSQTIVRYALLSAPALVLTALVVRQLRQRLEARERTFAELAEQALALTERIHRPASGMQVVAPPNGGRAAVTALRSAEGPPSARRDGRPERRRRRVALPTAFGPR